VNSNTSVTINWVAPFNGGSTITAYTVAILESDGVTFSELSYCTSTGLSCTFSNYVLKDAPYSLVNGASVYATVLAENEVGKSDPSAPGNGAVLPTVPVTPAAPTTTNPSNISVTITWVTPANGGSTITAYTVAIRQSDGTTFTKESANCNV
jgi:hypothetical protein